MAQAISVLGTHYATISDFLVGERDNDYAGAGPILEIPKGVVPVFTGNLQFRYGSATKYTFRAVAGDECVGNAMAGNLANIAVIDGGGFNLDFRNENINFENIFIHNFTLTTTGDSYDGLKFKGCVVDCYFYLRNGASTLGVSTDDTTIVLNSADPEPEIDKVVDISGSVAFHGLNVTIINKAGGVSGATGVIYNRSSAASTFNNVCVYSATNPSYVASGAGVPTGANNCAHDALMPGSVSSGVTAADFKNLADGDYRIEPESVPGLLGIGAFIQPVINVDPVLDTPLGNLSFEEGSTGTVILGGNFSDANLGDTLTFSDPVPALPSGYTFDNSNAGVTRDGTQVIAAQATFTITATDGKGGDQPIGTFTLTTTEIVPALNSIDVDNVVQAGQTGVAIATAGLPTVQPAGLVLQLNGKALTLETWNSGQPRVTVGDHIDIRWGRTDLQLSMNYTGLVDGPITLDNVTLQGLPNWIEATFNGVVPDVVGTESFQEHAQYDPEVGNYEMLINDVVLLEQIGDVVVDEQTIITKSSGTATGSFKIWRDAIGSHTGVSTYTITDEGAPVAVNQTPVVTAPADRTFGFLNGSAGLAHDDVALVAHIATATVSDDVDILTLNDVLAGLPNPLTAGDYTLTFSATDTGGETGSDSMLLTVVEADIVLTKKAKLTGIRDSNGGLANVTLDKWLLTQDNINQSNFDGVALTLAAKGVNLQVVNGSVDILTPDGALGGGYTFDTFNDDDLLHGRRHNIEIIEE